MKAFLRAMRLTVAGWFWKPDPSGLAGLDPHPGPLPRERGAESIAAQVAGMRDPKERMIDLAKRLGEMLEEAEADGITGVYAVGMKAVGPAEAGMDSSARSMSAAVGTSGNDLDLAARCAVIIVRLSMGCEGGVVEAARVVSDLAISMAGGIVEDVDG